MAVHRLGGTAVVMEQFDAEASLAAIEAHRVTHSQWVPTMFVRLFKLPAEVRERYDLSSQRVVLHAAAPCPVPVKEQIIEWWGPIVHEYYSSTEAIGVTIISSEEWLAHKGSVGRPMGAAAHICDEDGPGPAGRRGRRRLVRATRSRACSSSTTRTRPRPRGPTTTGGGPPTGTWVVSTRTATST